MPPVPTISARAPLKLLQVAEQSGLSTESLLQTVKLDAALLADADARIPYAKLIDLWETVMRLAPRPGAALDVAQTYLPGDYALVGFVCMNSGSLAEALGHVARYSRIWTDEPLLELTASGTFRARYRAMKGDRPGLRMAAEAALAEVLHGARGVLQDPGLTPRRVAFTHGPPDDDAPHRAFFGCAPVFGAAANELEFTREQLQRPLPRADGQLGVFLRGLAEDALARRAGGPSLLDDVRRAIAGALHQGLPSLRDLARHMKTSERTLRRRLDDEGTSFRDLVDEVRCELARAHVRDRRLPLAEIAFLLGFSDQSAFNRAFKRWTGTTPAVLRAQSG